MLVNNAGNFYAGYFEEISDAQFRAQMETNFFGPLNVTRAVLPVMRAQRSGKVVTITSTAGIVGGEFSAAYAASKFALEGWMESLRFDVAPFGISTTIVEPGFFRTELLVEGASSIWPELSIDDYAERTAQTIAAWKSMNGKQGGDPAKLAAALVKVVALEEPPLRWSPVPTRSPRSSRRPTTSSPRPTRTATCRVLSTTTKPDMTGDEPAQLTHGPAWANRYALAPMTNKQSHHDGTLSEDEYQWLVARGRGGFGVVKTCAAYVADTGRTWTGQLGIASDEHLPGLTRLAAGLRATGTRSLVQLHHGGLRADPGLAGRLIAPFDDPETGATAMSTEQVAADGRRLRGGRGAGRARRLRRGRGPRRARLPPRPVPRPP